MARWSLCPKHWSLNHPLISATSFMLEALSVVMRTSFPLFNPYAARASLSQWAMFCQVWFLENEFSVDEVEGQANIWLHCVAEPKIWYNILDTSFATSSQNFWYIFGRTTLLKWCLDGSTYH